MISRHEYRGGVWVDLEQPTEDEIRGIAHEFSISERLERELLSPTPTPLVASEGDMTLLVLHFPAHGAEDGVTESQEVDLIVSNHFILTVRYEVIAPLHHLQKLLEAQSLVSSKHATLTTDVLLEVLFAHLYTSMRDHTNHIVSRLTRIEEDMFDGSERKTILSILRVSREFLHMETTIASQEEPLGRFLSFLSQKNSFGSSFSEREGRILNERNQVARLVETHRAIAAELRETNIALLEARQNEIMKTLTIITVVVLPLELIAVTFGIHAPGTPFVNDPGSFWMIIGIMFGTMSLMTLFFARKHWLF